MDEKIDIDALVKEQHQRDLRRIEELVRKHREKCEELHARRREAVLLGKSFPK